MRSLDHSRPIASGTPTKGERDFNKSYHEWVKIIRNKFLHKRGLEHLNMARELFVAHFDFIHKSNAINCSINFDQSYTNFSKLRIKSKWSLTLRINVMLSLKAKSAVYLVIHLRQNSRSKISDTNPDSLVIPIRFRDKIDSTFPGLLIAVSSV